MKSEYYLKIFKAFVKKDEDLFYKVAWEIIENEKKKKNNLLYNELKKILNGSTVSSNLNGNKNFQPIPRDNEKGFRLFDIKSFYLSWDEVVLNGSTKDKLDKVLLEIKEEELLKSFGLKANKKLLFYGPPGTGKTLTAKVISSALGYPLLYIRFESVISSLLGETASNLQKIFNFIENGKWVVLFDEFDIVGKQRDDPTEHGEIKRVVNNFMLMLENYDNCSLIIASTNHPHILDIGVWRRFDDIVNFKRPGKNERKKIFKIYLRVIKKGEDIDYEKLAELSNGFSGADIEKACLGAVKGLILMGKEIIYLKDLYKSISMQKQDMEVQKGIKYE